MQNQLRMQIYLETISLNNNHNTLKNQVFCGLCEIKFEWQKERLF